jgi:CheY-like chemotaxis protein
MRRLIDDLLDVSRVSRGKIELRRSPLDVAQVVQQAIEVSAPMLEAGGLTLIQKFEPSPGLIVDGDGTRLALVLGNLLNNAAKFTPRGGSVTLAVRRDAADVELRVTDTGIGIPPDMLGRVFDMFVQVGREHGGLGIGLTMVRRLVELHGGRVWAESEGEGKGSTFVVRLPLVTPAVATETKTPTPTPPIASRRILVVDDNVDAAKMLAVLLELDHHVVRRAASAAEALEVLRTFKAEIALLDIGLPGMSGLDLARAIRADASLAGILLVAVTGWGQEDDLRRSREAGFDRHLTKPTEAEELAEVIASYGRPPNG